MADQRTKDSGSIEEALMQELRFSGIDKENLNELVRIVAGIHDGGLKRIKVFPKGQPPLIDGVRIVGTLELDALSKFFGEVLPKTPRLGGIGGFPLGTPRPDSFHVNIDIGASAVSNNPVQGGMGF